MKKFLLLFSILFIILQAGCAKSLRYSQEEIKDFPEGVQEHIRKNEIDTGMSKLQVRFAWGGPDAVNVLSPDEDGKERIEWVYKRLSVFKTRLIFTDDKLTQIISSEPGLIR